MAAAVLSFWLAPASADQGSLEGRLAVAAAADPELPSATARAAVVGRPVIVEKSSDARLVSVVLNYAGLTNRYCRLAFVDAAADRVELIPLPTPALHDHCKQLRVSHIADVNADGLPDVIHSVRIPSNAGPWDVEEAIVYLSRRGSQIDYCYSARASRSLAPKDLVSKAGAVRAIGRGGQGGKPSCDG